MADEVKKIANDEKFLLDIFTNNKPKQEVPPMPVYIKKEFTVKQTRKKSESVSIVQTNTENYQLYNRYKRRVEGGPADHGASTAVGKSSTYMSTSKASQMLESVLVTSVHKGRQRI